MTLCWINTLFWMEVEYLNIS